MAVTPNSIITVQTPKLDLLFMSTATPAAAYQNLSVGGANGSKITGIFASNSDSVTHLVFLGLSRGGGVQTFVGTNVTLGAGFSNGNPAVNLMSTAIWPGLPIDSDGNPFLFLQSTSDILQAQYTTAMSAGQVVNVAAVRGDF